MILLANYAEKTLEVRGSLLCRDRQAVTVIRSDGEAFATSSGYTLVVQIGNTNVASCTLTKETETGVLTGTLSTHTTEATDAFSLKGNPDSLDARVMLFDATNATQPTLIAGSMASMRYNSYGGDDEPAVPTTIDIGTATIAAAATTKAVTFTNAFDSAPRIVLAQIAKPTGGEDITVLTVGSITTTGFTATLSAAIPSTGYSIMWQARL